MWRRTLKKNKSYAERRATPQDTNLHLHTKFQLPTPNTKGDTKLTSIDLGELPWFDVVAQFEP